MELRPNSDAIAKTVLLPSASLTELLCAVLGLHPVGKQVMRDLLIECRRQPFVALLAAHVTARALGRGTVLTPAGVQDLGQNTAVCGGKLTNDSGPWPTHVYCGDPRCGRQALKLAQLHKFSADRIRDASKPEERTTL